MVRRLGRQAIAVLLLLVLVALIALAWIWVMAPHAPGILHQVGGLP
ncbi:MAG TPA: hypothetical protein VNF71_02675 [Acidimicrobiales bacterium]|nr:hypothetical protein [Acidimicrobiales bacterium]